MLTELTKKDIKKLSKELQSLSKQDKHFFHPHKFNIKTLENLIQEKGDHYYLYLNESTKFVGYGMLRTFGKYEIPTLGCVIWKRYRGYGDGKKLVEELVDKAKEIKYQKIRLKVYPDNKAAYKLYKIVGFKEIGKNEDGEIWMEYAI